MASAERMSKSSRTEKKNDQIILIRSLIVFVRAESLSSTGWYKKRILPVDAELLRSCLLVLIDGSSIQI